MGIQRIMLAVLRPRSELLAATLLTATILLAASDNAGSAKPPSVAVELTPAILPRPDSPLDRRFGEDTMHYDAEPDRGVLVSGVYEYAGGVRFTAPESLTVLAVLFYLTEPADLATVYIRSAGTELTPGPMIDSFRTNSGGSQVWKRADLPRVVTIPANTDFWTTITVRHSANMHPLTLDLGPMVVTRGGFISIPSLSPAWYQLTDPPFWTDRNWNIRAVVEYGQTGIEDTLAASEILRSCSVEPSIGHGPVTINYHSRRAVSAATRVYDGSGRQVRTLGAGTTRVGVNRVVWDGRDDAARPAAPGTYLCRVTANGSSAVGRFVLAE